LGVREHPAHTARAGGRSEAPLPHDRAAVLGRLLLDQPDQGSPAGVVDRPGQARAREARDRERLQADYLVLVDDPGGELVMVVEPGGRDLLVDTGDLDPGLGPVRGTLLPAGELPLGAGELAF